MLTIYSKENCAQCDQAKKLLEERGIKYEEVKVDIDSDARQFLLDSGHRSVPQVYKDGELFVTGGLAGLRTLSVEDLTKLKETI
jgi:glutaredoxin